MTRAPFLILLLSTGCGRGVIDGIWTGTCVLDMSSGPSSYYSTYYTYGYQVVLNLTLEIERDGKDLDGSGKFTVSLDRPSVPDTGYYGYSGYATKGDSGYYGSTGRFAGSLDGWLRGKDVGIELVMQNVLVDIEGTLDNDTIVGKCTAGADPEYYGYYTSSYSSNYTLSGDAELRRR